MNNPAHQVTGILGWDIGGAHLKACLLNEQRQVQQVWQLACPVWQGLPLLAQAVTQVLHSLPASLEHTIGLQHAVTMTAELVDLFDHRQQGVQAISQLLAQSLAQADCYAGKHGFVALSQATRYAHDIASANWLASASLLAQHHGDLLVVDIGSTTTDFLYLREGVVQNTAMDDLSRMQQDELLYTGVVRTPLMALAQRVQWQGQGCNVAAEYFATTADVYRLLGELAAEDDVAPSADGKDKSLLATQRRLARMLGCDREVADEAAWLDLAMAFKQAQCDLLQANLARLCARLQIPSTLALAGVGAGHFLVRHLAELSQRPYIDLHGTIAATSPVIAHQALVAFPAYAVAALYAQANDPAHDKAK